MDFAMDFGWVTRLGFWVGGVIEKLDSGGGNGWLRE